MNSRTTARRTVWAVSVALLGALVATPAAAAERGPSWVPYRAWKAVERTAKAQFDPQAKLFKSDATKAQSTGLSGANSSAWIVGAQRAAPAQGIMPYLPKQTYYLVAKDQRGRWQATELAGMGGYLTKVDALSQSPSVHVGVPGNPAAVCHGVEVANATRLAVDKGTALASKSNGPRTQTVYVKGATPSSPYAVGVEANIKASPPPSGWCGTVLPRNIPVSMSTVFFAQPLGQ